MNNYTMRLQRKKVIKNQSPKTSSNTDPALNPVLEFPKTVSTFLGNRGYSICKSEFTDEQLDYLKKQLTIQPMIIGMTFGGNKESSFPVYRESSKKIYMPRYFGETQFGKSQKQTISPGDDIDVTFA